MTRRYQVLPPTAPVPAPDDMLETIVRRGAQAMLQTVLEEEVDTFLGCLRYERADEHRGYRNGHLPERTIGAGMGAVEVRVPRVSNVPEEVSADGFQSEVVARYQRRWRTPARLLVRLYLEGLASGDFEPVFRALVGETAALSAVVGCHQFAEATDARSLRTEKAHGAAHSSHRPERLGRSHRACSSGSGGKAA